MKLRGSIVEVERISAKDRREMFALMNVCFVNAHSDRFEQDLSRKWVVIRVHEPKSGRLVGFSTQVVLHASVEGTPFHALFSGDTVVHPDHWGDSALGNQWGRLALRLIDRYRSQHLYWLLTSKGFRTYRYLPLFFREYFPAVGSNEPSDHVAALDVLGRIVGGGRYEPSTRIIRASENQDRVRPGISDPGARPRCDRHVRFFVERNPGFALGDELCCIAPLTRQNFSRAAYRVINAHIAAREAV